MRCVSTGDWVTAAETAECALALDALGRDDEALELVRWVQSLRNEDGSYWTGMVYPQESTFPPLERSSYTAGAMILAVDALEPDHAGLWPLPGRGLPSHLDLTEPAPDAPSRTGHRGTWSDRPALRTGPTAAGGRPDDHPARQAAW